MQFLDPEVLAKEAEALRTRALFQGDELGEDGTATLDPMAEEHFLQAVAFLELAQRQFTLAGYHQARALGARRGLR